jgi:hypothetical protein
MAEPKKIVDEHKVVVRSDKDSFIVGKEKLFL